MLALTEIDMDAMDSPRCPKCGHEMDRGLILDSGDLNRPRPPQWLKGQPDVGSISGNLKTAGQRRLFVITYRCGACGLLESYAPASPGSYS